MKHKSFPIQVWFLSENLEESARYLADKHLDKSICGCSSALMSTRMYFYGIRSSAAYKHYFSKENLLETLQDKFPAWPMRGLPKIGQYNSLYSKFARKCFEHYDLTLRYFRVLLDEWYFRFSKDHKLKCLDYWIEQDAPQLDIPLANLTELQLPWKVLPPKHRNQNIVEGYKSYYASVIMNLGLKIDSYSRRDIPNFLLDAGIEIQF